MSQSANREAAVSCEPEVEQVLSWFRACHSVLAVSSSQVLSHAKILPQQASNIQNAQAESYVDKEACAKLWDSVCWHRPVMDKARAFTVQQPWYSILAGAHVPEVFDATVQVQVSVLGLVVFTAGA